MTEEDDVEEFLELMYDKEIFREEDGLVYIDWKRLEAEYPEVHEHLWKMHLQDVDEALMNLAALDLIDIKVTPDGDLLFSAKQ